MEVRGEGLTVKRVGDEVSEHGEADEGASLAHDVLCVLQLLVLGLCSNRKVPDLGVEIPQA